MFKKFISALIIFSLFYTDVANAMQSEGAFFHDDMNVTVKSHPSLPPHTQPLRRVKSSESFNSFQESPPKVFSSPKLALPIGSNHTHESLTGSPLSSSLDSKKKSDDESHNEKFSKDLSDGSPTGSLNNEALSQVSSEQNSPSSLQDEVSFLLVAVGEKKPADPLASVVGNANLPVVSKKQLESDQEGETHVNPRGSIQELDIHSGSFTLPNKRGSVLDAFLSSSENKKKAPPTERTSLLQQSASRPSIQELKPTRDEKKDARELIVVSRTKEENPSVQDSDDILPLLANQLEEGRRSDFQSLITKVKRLKPDGDDTDKRVMAFLTYAKQHIVDGKFTWKQILLAGIFGTLIGGGYGVGMVPVLGGGLRGLGPMYFEYIYDNATGANISVSYIAITRGIDSIARNVKTIGNLAAPSTAEFSVAHEKYKIWKIPVNPRKAMVVAVCLGSATSSLLAFWYIWDVEQWNIKNGDPSLRAGSIGYIAGFGPCLFADALLLHARSVIPWVDERFNQRAIRRAFANPLSPESVVRQQELKRLKDLERFFKVVPDEDVHGLYEDVLVNGFKITKNGTHMPEIIKGADLLRVLKVLRKTHNDHRIPEEVKETWKKTLSEIAGWAIPIAATLGRSFVFYFIMDSLFESIGMPSSFGRGFMAWIFGGGLASAFLGKVEKDAVEDGVYDLLRGQEREGDASHSCVRSGFRKVGKGYNYLQGAEDTLPYLFAGVLATQGWPLGIQIIALTFFGIADLFNNTMGYHESYGDVFYTGESLASYAYASASYKRRKLLGLVRDLRQRFETLRPDVLMKVNTMVSNEENVTELDHL